MSKTKAKGTKRGLDADKAVLKCRHCDQLGHTTKDEGKCLCNFCGQPGSPLNLDGHATKHCEAVKQIVMKMFGLDETDRVIDARIYASIYGVAKLPQWTGTWQEVVILARDQVHRALEEAQEEEEAQLVVGAKIAKAVEKPNGSFGIQWLRCVGEIFSPEAKHILEQVLKDGERARDSEGRPIIVICKTEEDPATGKVCSWPLDPAKAPREAFTAQNQDVFQREMAKRELAEQAKRQRV
jgi:hypothetical protein